MDLDVELTGHFLGHPGQRGGFLVLAGLLGGFLFIRTSARMIRAEVSWWPGNVETGSGLHIHHLVWGIVTLMLTGFLFIARRRTLQRGPAPAMRALQDLTHGATVEHTRGAPSPRCSARARAGRPPLRGR